ncbi:MAG: n-acetylglutamate synthase [Chitinophagaceae bacterium]|nr:MAG: n-acetylglutamate synthase [Chitinophagaceae bacterium]
MQYNRINYDGRVFRSAGNTENGEVSPETVFHYRQSGKIVTAVYSGGAILIGQLLATVDDEGRLDMRYHHVNTAGVLMTGTCISVPEVLPDGRLRLHEQWQWTSGDGSSGSSVVEEVERPK